ncbi:recombinase family protein [Bacillus cereus]|uniref:Recombinase family protein n=1 Tax=Bacillus cereus TaxID=1396 RepID=A0A9X7CR75_BACCE|nr:recombinase family protein [Bacillus cereus]PGS81665.1 recombinase family protein [Bacillus cereus]
MKKCAIYVRVSTIEQAESGYSIGEQIAKLEKFCELHDWTIYNVYKDGGFSGSNLERPAISQLIKHAKEKRFDCVVVYKLDRLSRSQKDTLFLIEDVFLKNDIDFMSMLENFDTSSAFGKAMIGILSVFAQLEREQIKERFQLGKLGRAKSGKPMNYVKPKFGYKLVDGELVINELEADVVRRAFKAYIGGMSRVKVMEMLNDEGHIGKSKPWSRTTMTAILNSKTYIGLVNYKDQYFEGNHEPIISLEDFEKAQEIAENRRRTATNSRPFEGKHLLSGLIHCAKCGANMEIKASLSQIAKGTERYGCQNKKRVQKVNSPEKKNKTCESVTLPRVDIENSVIDEVVRIQTDENYFQSVSTQNKNTFDEKGAKQEIKKIENKINKLNDLYMNDLITLDNLKEQTASLKLSKQTLIQQIQDSQEENAKKIDMSAIPDILTVDKATQKNIINTLIKRIDVDDTTLSIHWAF